MECDEGAPTLNEKREPVPEASSVPFATEEEEEEERKVVYSQSLGNDDLTTNGSLLNLAKLRHLTEAQEEEDQKKYQGDAERPSVSGEKSRVVQRSASETSPLRRSRS